MRNTLLITAFFLRIVFSAITSDEQNFGLFYRSGKMLEIIWRQEPIVIGSCRCRLWST